MKCQHCGKDFNRNEVVYDGHYSLCPHCKKRI